jgi:hypothetical protein
MVNTCANPECRKTLRYLRDGIVYLFSSKSTYSHPGAIADAALPKEHFWLCGACAETWALKTDRKGSVQMIPRAKRRKHLPDTDTGRALPYVAV